MKKTILTLSTFLLTLPFLSEAHTGAGVMMMNFNESGFQMMQSVEDRALGEDVHEEMEELMVKMMSGALTEEETGRMISLMNEYPGPYGMMMSRMMGMNFGQSATNFNMMPWGFMSGYGGGLWFLFMGLGWLIWVAVGLLLVVWLWKQITKKQ